MATTSKLTVGASPFMPPRCKRGFLRSTTPTRCVPGAASFGCHPAPRCKVPTPALLVLLPHRVTAASSPKTAASPPPRAQTFGVNYRPLCAVWWVRVKGAMWCPVHRRGFWRSVPCPRSCDKWRNSSRQPRHRWSAKSCWRPRSWRWSYAMATKVASTGAPWARVWTGKQQWVCSAAG